MPNSSCLNLYNIKGDIDILDIENTLKLNQNQLKRDYIVHNLISGSNLKYIALFYDYTTIIQNEFLKSLFGRFSDELLLYEKTDSQYLYLLKKKDNNSIIYNSPLNYTGNKFDLIPFIKNNLPDNIKIFYDLFGGGMNVSINIEAETIIYNEINYIIKDLLNYLIKEDTLDILYRLQYRIKDFNLEIPNKEDYLDLRNYYNNNEDYIYKYIDLYLLIIYGFQHQIRFNSKHKFNNPFGNSSYNSNLEEKLLSFKYITNKRNIKLFSKDYSEYLDIISTDDFVYLDPPYLITLGNYNDGKRGFNGWNDKEEKRLLDFLTELDRKNIRFMLSNVPEHKNKTNTILKDWINLNKFRVIECPYKIKSNRKEIIVTNY